MPNVLVSIRLHGDNHRVQLLTKRSLLVAAQAGKAELVAQHIANGADLAARLGAARGTLRRAAGRRAFDQNHVGCT